MKRHSRPLFLEPLEERALLSTCHVTRLSDAGAGFGFRGDLRYCINKVNSVPGPDTIDFKVTGTINLTGALPALATDMDIVGPGPDAMTVRRNTGGDYRIFSVDLGVVVELSGLTLANGLVGDIGGGILNRGTLTLEDMRIFGNQASGAAGGYASAQGGGIYNTGTLTITGSAIVSNSSKASSLTNSAFAYGGGIYNAGPLTIVNSVVNQNMADADSSSNSHNHYAFGLGGAIYNANHAKLTLMRTTVANNQALASSDYLVEIDAAEGGGIEVESGNIAISDSTISDNYAAARDSYGGGMLIGLGGTLVMTNSTVSGNDLGSAWGDAGAGIFIYESSKSTITHSTIAGNGYGGGLNAGNALTLRNSIVAANEYKDLFGKLASSGYNLIGDSSTGSGYVPSDILGVDPLLGPLADNGGPTLTMVLLPGSPAIDSGTNHMAPEWDQRGPGFPRIVNGAIDRGAFEVQATSAPGAGRRFPNPEIALAVTPFVDRSAPNRMYRSAMANAEVSNPKETSALISPAEGCFPSGLAVIRSIRPTKSNSFQCGVWHEWNEKWDESATITCLDATTIQRHVEQPITRNGQ